MMKRIAVAIPKTAVESAVYGSIDFLHVANTLGPTDRTEPLFRIVTVGEGPLVNMKNKGMFKTDDLIGPKVVYDLILVPPVSGDMDMALKQNRGLMDWLAHQYGSGAQIANLCLGSFLSAGAGILDGKTCSTHWMYAARFRELYPKVNLELDKAITDQDGIYSSGGATMFWNLLLYMMEKLVNRELALTLSKYYMLDMNKCSQLAFLKFNGEREHGDPLILDVQNYIEDNLGTRPAIDELCGLFHIRRRTLERKFKKLTNHTILEYIQKAKMERAKKLLEKKGISVLEIMNEVGYSDPKAFRKVFKHFCGLTPTQYKSNFSRLNPASFELNQYP